MGHAELPAPGLAIRIDIHADDHAGADHPGALDHVETNSAQTEDDHIGAGLDPRRIDHRADPRGDAAADIASLVEGGVGPDLGQGDFRQDRVVGEG